MPLPILARRVKRLAAGSMETLAKLLKGESSRGFSKFKKLYKLRGELGRGGFGIVYRAVRISDDLPVAVKFIDRNNVKEWGRVAGEQVPMEIAMLNKCKNCKGVIKMYDWFSIPEGYLIIMERPYPCVDMFDFIKGQGKLDEDMARFLFRQIVSTVYDCNGARVLHRDLKDENIVIDLINGQTKLIDFGAATNFRRSQFSDFQGTRLYCPPEWFLHSLYLGREATVWSLGVLLYNSLNGRLPFRNEKDICTAHLLGPLPFYATVSAEAKDLIQKCLAFDPFKRCSVEQILNHAWLKTPDLSWECLTTPVEKENKENSEASSSGSSGSDKMPKSDGEESGVGSLGSSTVKPGTSEPRISKTSLLIPPTSMEIQAVMKNTKTTTQYNINNAALRPQRPRRVQQPNSTVLTALRRAMTKEAQKKITAAPR